MTTTTETAQAPESVSTNGPSEMLIVMLVSACTFTSVLSTTMFNVVLPEISREFSVSASTVGWLFTAYSLVFAVATTFYGRLGDLYGIRRFLLIGIAIFSTGALVATVAPSFATLIAARVLQACGAAAIPALGTATIFRLVPAHRRGLAMGYMSAVIGSGAGLGPVLGGALAEFVTWRVLFLIPGALVLIIPILLRLLPALEGRGRGGLDIVGGVFMGVGLAGLLISVTSLESSGIASPAVWGPFSLFIVGMTLLVWRVSSREDAFIPRQLLASRNYVLLGVTALGMTMTAMGSMVTIPLLLDAVQGVTVGLIGIIMLPSAAMSAVLGPVGGRLADQFGSVVPLRMGIASLFIGAALVSTFGTSGSAWAVAILGIFIGAGMGLAGAPLLNSVSMILPSSQAGVGVSLIHMLFLLGGSFGVTLMTVIADTRTGIDDSINPFHSGAGAAFADTFLVGCLASGTALALALILRVPRPGEQPATERTASSVTRPSKT